RRIGRIELAHGGTLLLDDVDDIPLGVQVKLVRVLQERTLERVGSEQPVRVNIRVIAATKSDLSVLVAAGRFREDLFYRLSVVPLQMPPLRERMEDVPLLVAHFADKCALEQNRGKLTVTPGALARLHSYHWPGNVRELEHVLERMVALSRTDVLTEQDVPELVGRTDAGSLFSLNLDSADAIDMTSLLSDAEARIVCWALERSRGNLAKAAELLGVPRSTLQYKVSKLAAPEDSPYPPT
ncbi:MAG: sigma 54-interacting transcriptional regulator, partial [Planctomycetota bacterium]